MKCDLCQSLDMPRGSGRWSQDAVIWRRGGSSGAAAALRRRAPKGSWRFAAASETTGLQTFSSGGLPPDRTNLGCTRLIGAGVPSYGTRYEVKYGVHPDGDLTNVGTGRISFNALGEVRKDFQVHLVKVGLWHHYAVISDPALFVPPQG